MSQTTQMHVQILSELLSPREVKRTEIRYRLDKPIRDPKTYTAFPVKVPVPTIAGNVSALNIDRAAKRWIK